MVASIVKNGNDRLQGELGVAGTHLYTWVKRDK